MVAVFGGVGLFVLLALAIGAARCMRELKSMSASATQHGSGAALRDALTLNHLHVAGSDCVTGPEVRTPWRRRLHHATFYGFALCFASTCVATLYHLAGAPAPYAYTSLPVLLGTRRRRRPRDRHCGIARCSGAAATQRYRTQPTAISIVRSSCCCC